MEEKLCEVIDMTKFTSPNWTDVPSVLTAQQVADLIGVHINTVKRITANGQLPHFNVGAAIRYNKVDVMRFAGLLNEDNQGSQDSLESN